MDYPNRLEWQTRCEFNAYCKRTLRNELIDACRESRSRQKHEVNFSDLAPHEEKQLYTVDRYFVNEDEDAFCAGGLKITAKLLAEAMRSLPEEKRQAVLLYYFFSMTDTEIAELKVGFRACRDNRQYREQSLFTTRELRWFSFRVKHPTSVSPSGNPFIDKAVDLSVIHCFAGECHATVAYYISNTDIAHCRIIISLRYIRPIPPPDIMPASFCNFFTLCILEEENQIHGISIIEHEEPSQN